MWRPFDTTETEREFCLVASLEFLIIKMQEMRLAIIFMTRSKKGKEKNCEIGAGWDALLIENVDDWARESGNGSARRGPAQHNTRTTTTKGTKYLNLPKPKRGIRTPLGRVTKAKSWFCATLDVVGDAICPLAKLNFFSSLPLSQMLHYSPRLSWPEWRAPTSYYYRRRAIVSPVFFDFFYSFGRLYGQPVNHRHSFAQCFIKRMEDFLFKCL